MHRWHLKTPFLIRLCVGPSVYMKVLSQLGCISSFEQSLMTIENDLKTTSADQKLIANLFTNSCNFTLNHLN